MAGAAGGGGERRGGGEVSPAAVATGSQSRFLLVHPRREQNWKLQVRTLECREKWESDLTLCFCAGLSAPAFQPKCASCSGAASGACTGRCRDLRMARDSGRSVLVLRVESRPDPLVFSVETQSSSCLMLLAVSKVHRRRGHHTSLFADHCSVSFVLQNYLVHR